MKNREIVRALKRGFGYDKEKYMEALMQLGILHWAEEELKWRE